MAYLSRLELSALGFGSVGEETRVSRLASFHAISGSLGDRVRIDDFAVLTGHLILGNDVHVSPFCFLNGTGGGITCQDETGMGAGSTLLTLSDEYEAPVDLGPRGKLRGRILIGKRSILGTDVVVLPGVTIGEGCSVGTRCTLVEDLPPATKLVSTSIKSIRQASGEFSSDHSNCRKCSDWLLSQQSLMANVAKAGGKFDSLSFIELLEIASEIDDELGVRLSRRSLESRSMAGVANALHDSGLCEGSVI